MKPSLMCCLTLLLATSVCADDWRRQPVHDVWRAGEVFVEDALHVFGAPLRLDGDSALKTTGVLAVGGLIYHWDQEVRTGLRDVRHDQPYRPFGELGDFLEPLGHARETNKYWFGALAASYAGGWKKGSLVFAQILEAQFIAGLGVQITQDFIGRQRPYGGQGPRSFGNDDATSLPSGHATNITQLAIILSHHVDRPWFTVVAYLGGLSVAFQRVTSNQHWPSDVWISVFYAGAVARSVVARHAERGWDPGGGESAWRLTPTATPAGPALAFTRGI